VAGQGEFIKNWEVLERETSLPISKYIPATFLKGLSKTAVKVSFYWRRPG
jgi:hypothetical protein